MIILESFWGFESLKDILSVVLIPLVLGICGLLIPHFWAKKQRNSETKTLLVTEISELVMTTIMSLHLTKESYISSDRSFEKELDEVYKRWTIETCVIGSKLHAYFPHPEKGEKQIHRKWHIFSDQLSNYFKKNRTNENRIDLQYFEKEKNKLFNEKAIIIAEILTTRISGFQQKYQPH